MHNHDENLLVSIIIPIYNVENYLTECIDSVVGQTYENLEIVIVDDGSTDESGEIADRYAKNDSRIKVIHQENTGLNMARAAGFKLSTGGLVAFLDSDDFLNIEFAGDCVASMRNHDVDIVIGKIYRFLDGKFAFPGNESQYESVIVAETRRNMAHLITNTSPLADTTKNFSPPNDVEMMSVCANKMFRRELVDKVDWRLSNYKTSEDYPTMSQIYVNLMRGILYVDKTYYYYRNARPGSITNQASLAVNSFNGEEFPWIGYIERVVVHSYRSMATQLNFDLSREITLIAARLYANGINALAQRYQLTIDDWNAYVKHYFLPNVPQIMSLEFKHHTVDNKYLSESQYEYIHSFAKRVADHPDLLEFLQSLANDYRNELTLNQNLWGQIRSKNAELKAMRDSRAWKLAKQVGRIKHRLARSTTKT